jgi:hypothetical protein
MTTKENSATPTNRLTVNFNHRLSSADFTSSAGLADNVSLMADRAFGILHLLQAHLETNRGESVTHDFATSAVDSVMQEITDILATVEAFHEHDISVQS